MKVISDVIKSLKVVFGIDITEWHLKDYIEAYEEKHRHYHGTKHIEDLVGYINNDEPWKGVDVNEVYDLPYKEILTIIAFFHDVVYIPGEKDNETKSAEVFVNFISYYENDENFINKNYIDFINNAIIDTQYNKPVKEMSFFGAGFFTVDCFDLVKKTTNYNKVIENELRLFKEFQFFPYAQYKKGKGAFINNFYNLYGECLDKHNLDLLKEYVDNFVPKVGLYIRKFTNGISNVDLKIIEKAEKVFDKVIIGVYGNSEENYKLVKDYFKFYEVVTIDGLLNDFIKRHSEENGYDITLVRRLTEKIDINSEFEIQDTVEVDKVVHFLTHEAE